MRQIQNEVVGFEFSKISDIIDSINNEDFVKESWNFLRLPSFEAFQVLDQDKKFIFVVTQKWIRTNHCLDVSFLQLLLQWVTVEQKTNESLLSVIWPVILPNFQVNHHFTFFILQNILDTCLRQMMEEGGVQRDRIKRLQGLSFGIPWNDIDEQHHKFAEHMRWHHSSCFLQIAAIAITAIIVLSVCLLSRRLKIPKYTLDPIQIRVRAWNRITKVCEMSFRSRVTRCLAYYPMLRRDYKDRRWKWLAS